MEEEGKVGGNGKAKVRTGSFDMERVAVRVEVTANYGFGNEEKGVEMWEGRLVEIMGDSACAWCGKKMVAGEAVAVRAEEGWATGKCSMMVGHLDCVVE